MVMIDSRVQQAIHACCQGICWHHFSPCPSRFVVESDPDTDDKPQQVFGEMHGG